MNPDLFDDQEDAVRLAEQDESEMPSVEFIQFNRHDALVNSKSQNFNVPGGYRLQADKSLPFNRRANAKLVQKLMTPSNKVIHFTQLKLNSQKHHQ